MIPAGLSNALAAWAFGDESRIGRLKAERDALVNAFMSGGQPTSVLTSAAFNGGSWSWDPRLSVEEKLTVVTDTLIDLGEIDPRILPVHLTYGAFSRIER